MKTGDGGVRPARDGQLAAEVDSPIMVGVAAVGIGAEWDRPRPGPWRIQRGADAARVSAIAQRPGAATAPATRRGDGAAREIARRRWRW